MPRIHLDPNAKTDYVLREDRDQDDPPVFHLRMPTVAQRNALERALFDAPSKSAGQQLQVTEDVLRAGLAGWDWTDENGAAVPFEKAKDGRASQESIARLTAENRAELMTEILELMGMEKSAQD